MKKITKDNKGITLVALIITIIIMLILTSVTVYTGINTYNSSKVNAFVTKMQLLQTKVFLELQFYSQYILLIVSSYKDQNANNPTYFYYFLYSYCIVK